MLEKITSSKNNIIFIFYRSILLIIGGLVTGLGISISVNSDWGPEPMTMFYGGLVNTFGVTTGQAQNIVAFTFIILVIFFDWRQLGIGTVLLPLIVKIGIDFGMSLWNFSDIIPIVRLFILFVGFSVMSLGIAITINADMGKGAYDAFVLSICKKTNLKYHQIRRPIDFLILISGIFLGGNFTITTILAVFIIGKIISVFNDLLKKVLPSKEFFYQKEITQ